MTHKCRPKYLSGVTLTTPKEVRAFEDLEVYTQGWSSGRAVLIDELCRYIDLVRDRRVLDSASNEQKYYQLGNQRACDWFERHIKNLVAGVCDGRSNNVRMRLSSVDYRDGWDAVHKVRPAAGAGKCGGRRATSQSKSPGSGEGSSEKGGAMSKYVEYVDGVFVLRGWARWLPLVIALVWSLIVAGVMLWVLYLLGIKIV